MSRSPLEGFNEGPPPGQSHYQHEPIRPIEEEVEQDSPCRVLMRDGEWTAEASPADKRRLTGQGEPPFKEGPMLRAWAADVVRRKHKHPAKRNSTNHNRS